MKNSKFGKTALVASAVALAASLSVGSALGYFTTYCTADGSYEISMGFPETSVDEEVENGQKKVTIVNIGKYDCYVRVKVFATDEMLESIRISSEKGNGAGEWIEFPQSGSWEDDYWYFNSILAPGKRTPELIVAYTLPNAGQDENAPEEVNIVVVQECTPVLYDEDGNPYADWENVVTLVSREDGTENAGTSDSGTDDVDASEEEQGGE